MEKKKNELPVDIYHRIYRFAARKISIDQIAVTLDLPINTVKNVVEYFFSTSKKNTVTNRTEKDFHKSNLLHDEKSYLDIYIIDRLRFSIIDLTGMITKKHNSYLQTELDKAFKSDSKPVALLMASVKAIDETGLSTLLSFHKKFLDKGRYTAILDPSTKIEAFITKNELEEKIPIFGTEKAFEDNAFKTKKQK